jgi:hypothetical protein
VHIVGADVFCAAQSHDHATALCDALKAALRRNPLAPGFEDVEPRVEPWPLSVSEWAEARAVQNDFERTNEAPAPAPSEKDVGNISCIAATVDVATDRVELPIEGWDVMTTETPADPATLWCMHVVGPDDVYAMPSMDAAAEACAALNASIAASGLVGAPGAPDIEALVAEWPHSASSHADDLAMGDSRYG